LKDFVNYIEYLKNTIKVDDDKNEELFVQLFKAIRVLWGGLRGV